MVLGMYVTLTRKVKSWTGFWIEAYLCVVTCTGPYTQPAKSSPHS